MPMTPLSYYKIITFIITLKKHTYKSENIYIIHFTAIIFLKVTILIKSMHTNSKYNYNSFSY